MGKEGVGTIIEGVKYVYNSFNDWVKQFPWLSVWQFRKAMKLLRDLGVVEVIRYKSRQSNQTNYYTLNSDRLIELIQPKKAEARLAFAPDGDVSLRHETPENSELWDSTDREVRNQQIEVRDTNISYIETKKTVQKETADSRNSSVRRSHSCSPDKREIAAVFLKTNLEQEYSKEEIHHSQELNACIGQNKPKLEDNQKVVTKQKSSADCSIKEVKIINTEWRSLVEELDGLGVQINKTLISLVKIYSEEEVRKAVALLKIRKREKFIPNMAGYFTAALKGGWINSSVTKDEPTDEESINKADIFRLWYELAKELGYCSGQEVREGEQWVLLSGKWERWEEASNRGYSLFYLKKVMKRNQEC